MQLAIDKSAENLDGKSGGPFGAVIIKDDQLITATANKVMEQTDPTAHAEIQAIREACRQLQTTDLSGCTIYASCEPCPMCLGAIYWTGIDKIYYAADRYDAQRAGFDDRKIYDELKKQASQRTKPTTVIESAKARKIFDKWINPETM